MAQLDTNPGQGHTLQHTIPVMSTDGNNEGPEVALISLEASQVATNVKYVSAWPWENGQIRGVPDTIE